jgi:hypothetical protein
MPWQQIFVDNLGGDGIVGPNTWSHADNHLVQDGTLVAYQGLITRLFFTRSSVSPGNYTWSWNFSPYYYTGYTGIQIAKTTSNCHMAP